MEILGFFMLCSFFLAIFLFTENAIGEKDAFKIWGFTSLAFGLILLSMHFVANS